MLLIITKVKSFALLFKSFILCLVSGYLFLVDHLLIYKIFRMFHSYVCSGTIYDICFAIKSDEGDFTPEQVAMLNAQAPRSIGATEVNCSHFWRTGNIYLVTTPNGGIPCDPEEKLRRSYEVHPAKYGDR